MITAPPPNYNTWQIWHTLKQSGVPIQVTKPEWNNSKDFLQIFHGTTAQIFSKNRRKIKVSCVQWCPFHDPSTPACSWEHLHHSKASNLKGFSSKSTEGFPPKSSILIGFSIINHPFWGIPIFGNTHIIYYVILFSIYLWNKSFEVATPMLV